MKFINEKELRVGNYIWNTHGFKQVVSAEDILDLSNYKDLKPERCQYFTPIKITKEWMVQFNASVRIVNHSIVEYSIVCTPDNYKKEYRLVFRFGEQKDKKFNFYWYPFKDSGDMHIFPCEYVHQLQNIHFALTQTELK